MTPKMKIIRELETVLEGLVPEHGKHLDVTLPNQALRAPGQAPYINISPGLDSITTPAPKSRDHRVQVSVARVHKINQSSIEENDNFELNVMGLIDQNPTLNGLAHRCRPISVNPTRTDEQLVAHEITLEIHFSYRINV